jgi:beta-mannosidase
MRVTTLCQGWQFRRADARADYQQYHADQLDWLAAKVPGAIHVDLAKHGVIGDPFYRTHEAGIAWVDEAEWDYRLSFDWLPSPGNPKRVLRFDGLDTVCTLRLNGSPLGEHDNMFTAFEADVTDALKEGENLLEVRFHSATKVGDQRRRKYLEEEGLPNDVTRFDERPFVRKSPYMSGWDWGPRLISCGIWKPVQLLEFATRIKNASFLQEALSDGRFRVWVEADVEGPGKVGAEFAGQVRNPGEKLEFFIENPRLWWPSGDGEQHLYEGRVFLDDGQEIRKSIGLRTIRLLREDDEHGTSFEFEVNGRRIWSKGANWVPNDSFPGRETSESTTASVRTCKRIGMNMLRVWGGGIYESEAFYDACDREGIMVWQDFVYACSYYPDGPAAQEIAFREAKENVLRLRDRTCLAIWCGNNENKSMFEGPWGPPDKRPPRFYGENIYDITLPEVLRQFDPARPYITSSPLLTNDETHSDQHYWRVWHGGDYHQYSNSKARFCSEFGFASSCGMECWKTCLAPEDVDPRSLAVRWHDKTGKTAEVFEGFVADYYPEWKSLEEWTYFSQLNQRDALRFGIEHYRRSAFCRGALIWQFNDCWPVQSWAVQDYSRLLKPAGFELARVYAPLTLSLEHNGCEMRVHLINDTAETFQGTITLEAISTLNASLIGRISAPARMGANERSVVLIYHLDHLDSSQTAIRAHIEGQPDTETWAFLAKPKDTAFAKPEITAEAGTDLRLTVKGFAADLVAYDPEDPYNVFDPATGEPGWRAWTIANGPLSLAFRRQPKHLRVRTLYGVQDIAITSLSRAEV